MMPILPVRQKAHSIAQPTWVEMQKVCDGVSGMKTDSMSWPSASSSRNLVVPSTDRSCLATAGVLITQCARRAPRAARVRGRSSPRSRSRRGDRSSGRSGAPWKRGTPVAARCCSISSSSSSAEVDANGGGHGGGSCGQVDPSFYYADSGAFWRVSALNCAAPHGNIPFWLIAAKPFHIKTCAVPLRD